MNIAQFTCRKIFSGLFPGSQRGSELHVGSSVIKFPSDLEETRPSETLPLRWSSGLKMSLSLNRRGQERLVRAPICTLREEVALLARSWEAEQRDTTGRLPRLPCLVPRWTSRALPAEGIWGWHAVAGGVWARVEDHRPAAAPWSLLGDLKRP